MNIIEESSIPFPHAATALACCGDYVIIASGRLLYFWNIHGHTLDTHQEYMEKRVAAAETDFELPFEPSVICADAIHNHLLVANTDTGALFRVLSSDDVVGYEAPLEMLLLFDMPRKALTNAEKEDEESEPWSRLFSTISRAVLSFDGLFAAVFSGISPMVSFLCLSKTTPSENPIVDQKRNDFAHDFVEFWDVFPSPFSCATLRKELIATTSGKAKDVLLSSTSDASWYNVSIVAISSSAVFLYLQNLGLLVGLNREAIEDSIVAQGSSNENALLDLFDWRSGSAGPFPRALVLSAVSVHDPLPVKAPHSVSDELISGTVLVSNLHIDEATGTLLISLSDLSIHLVSCERFSLMQPRKVIQLEKALPVALRSSDSAAEIRRRSMEIVAVVGPHMITVATEDGLYVLNTYKGQCAGELYRHQQLSASTPLHGALFSESHSAQASLEAPLLSAWLPFSSQLHSWRLSPVSAATLGCTPEAFAAFSPAVVAKRWDDNCTAEALTERGTATNPPSIASNPPDDGDYFDDGEGTNEDFVDEEYEEYELNMDAPPNVVGSGLTPSTEDRNVHPQEVSLAEESPVVDMLLATRPLPTKFTDPLPLEETQPGGKKPSSSAAAAKPAVSASTGRPLPGSTTKPVTFGHKIKSSGYSAAATKPFSHAQQKKKTAKSALVASPIPAMSYDCIAYDRPPTKIQKTSADVLTAAGGPIHAAAVTALDYDAHGTMLLSGSNDHTLHALKVPVVKYGGKGTAFRGHTAPVLSVNTSMSPKTSLVVSGGSDGCIALWQPTLREAPLVMEKVTKTKEVTSVRFFYMDKLIVAAVGPDINLYRYALDRGGGDLDRARNLSRVVCCTQYRTDAQSVSAVGCLNSILSNAVVFAGSNRDLGVVDFEAERTVWLQQDAHKSPIRALALMSGSRFCHPALDGGALHTVATATGGHDPSVRLWDLRQRSCMLEIARRTSPSTQNLCFSPCGRFLAVGGDDRALSVYDLRSTGAELSRIACAELVTSITYHPLRPILAIGCGNGDVRFVES